MKQAFYSEKLNKYFDTAKECLDAEAKVNAKDEELKTLQNELDDLSEKAEIVAHDVKEYVDKYHSVNLTFTIGEHKVPICLNTKDIKEGFKSCEKTINKLSRLIEDIYFPSFDCLGIPW